MRAVKTIPARSNLCLAACFAGLLLYGCSADGSRESRPNIVLILADDLGYGDLGCYGQQNIETPHVDALATGGILFTDHYAGAPVCAPSRCVLLTGKHSGHAQIRGNDEWNERGEVWDYTKAVHDPNLEGQRPLSGNTVTVASLLKSAGYTTGIVGKWGLGAPLSGSTPNDLGFDFFYGYNCQRQAHTHYPVFLWKNREKSWLDNELVVPGTRLEERADPYDEASYAKYNQKEYAPALMHREAIRFIRENRDHPFFLYYASSIPHVALQAPDDLVDHYVEKFGDEEPYDGSQGYFPCRYPRATYAAMISCLDQQVGELILELKKAGVYGNTVVIFTSDNGLTFNGGTDSPWFDSGGPFKSEYGWGKGFVHEGGIRVPLIVSWPARITGGRKSAHISAFYDVMPTLCEIAGIGIPDGSNGMSMLPVLSGNEAYTKLPHYYWEFPQYGGQQAVRMGNWKAIRRDIQKGNLQVELYNLEEDIQEIHDISAEHPEMVKKMEAIMLKDHKTPEIKMFRMEALDDD